MTRSLGPREYEGNQALVALAGIRQLKQTSISVGSSAENTYTVTEVGTRRVVCLHLATNNNDIRFDYNATATSTDMPVIPARYFVVDSEKDDVLHFYNTSGGAITVYLMEVE